MASTSERSADSLHSGTDAAARLAHEAIDKVAKRAELAEERIRNSADDAERRIRKSLQSARSKGVELKGEAGQLIYKHPLASIGIAVGVGLLISLLVKRNRPTAVEGASDLH